MLGPFFEFVDKLTSEFSWRRIILVVALLLLLIAAVWIYEAYTDHFKLRKIERATELLSKLSDLSQKSDIHSDEELEEIYDDLKRELDSIFGLARQRALSPRMVNVMAAALPWFLICLFYIPNLLRGNRDNVNVIVGILLMASPFLLIAGLLPTFRQSWINHWLYPWSGLVVVLMIILIRHKKKKPA